MFWIFSSSSYQRCSILTLLYLSSYFISMTNNTNGFLPSLNHLHFSPSPNCLAKLSYDSALPRSQPPLVTTVPSYHSLDFSWPVNKVWTCFSGTFLKLEFLPVNVCFSWTLVHSDHSPSDVIYTFVERGSTECRELYCPTWQSPSPCGYRAPEIWLMRLENWYPNFI